MNLRHRSDHLILVLVFQFAGVWWDSVRESFVMPVGWSSGPTVHCAVYYSPYQFPHVHQTVNASLHRQVQTVSSNFWPTLRSAWVLLRNAVTVALKLPVSCNHWIGDQATPPGSVHKFGPKDLSLVKVLAIESRVLPGPICPEALEYRRTSVKQIIFSWTRPQLLLYNTCDMILISCSSWHRKSLVLLSIFVVKNNFSMIRKVILQPHFDGELCE